MFLRITTSVLATAALASALLAADPTLTPSHAEVALREDSVEAQIESGAIFDVGHQLNYTLAPQVLSVNWNLDEIGNSGWLRGNTQFKFSALLDPVITGPENRFLGFAAGPQYNFIQPGSNWVPFVGARVGIGFIDSTNVKYAQGQDFCFTFIVTSGVRYYFSDRWSMGFEGFYEHISNGGLSEPKRMNNGLDAVGPEISVSCAF